MVKEKKELNYSLIKSWLTKDSKINSNKEIHSWIINQNNQNDILIKKKNISTSNFWLYDKKYGGIRNKSDSFFSIRGININSNNNHSNINYDQPIIIQDEIGFLGIICKKFKDTMYFLIQAKIEPGNINKIQLSPTIQATKSNFLQKHGGSKPLYLDFFINHSSYTVIVDQIQSEQSSRFLKKRNRNVVLDIGQEEIEISETHKWMTLGQIKKLMECANLVNMDTRSVVSCIPFSSYTLDKETENMLRSESQDQELINSIYTIKTSNNFNKIFSYINDFKMFNDYSYTFKDLYSLDNWSIKDNELVCDEDWPFKLIFCQIEISNRENQKWDQPLLEANEVSTFGLIAFNDNGVKKFIVKATPEIGCFDQIELGPTVMLDTTKIKRDLNPIENIFHSKLSKKNGIIFNGVLSEEGGRFYHEQNNNVIIEIDKSELPDLEKEYFCLNFSELNGLIKINNVINIQLRNLISLLKI